MTGPTPARATTPRIRREYGATMLAVATGAGLMLAASGRVWATGELAAPGPVEIQLRVHLDARGEHRKEAQAGQNANALVHDVHVL